MRRLVVSALLAAGSAAGVQAETIIRIDRPLSDEAFYRVITCGAKPDGACRFAFSRWGRRARQDLRIAILPPEPGFPPVTARLVEQNVNFAIREIMQTGAGIRLRKALPSERPQITIRLTGLQSGDAKNGVPGVPMGTRIGNAHMVCLFRDGVIEDARILIAADIRAGVVRRAVLEDAVQALGLPVDVEGTGYACRTIFDQHCMDSARLRGQDASVLRRHYPPR